MRTDPGAEVCGMAVRGWTPFYRGIGDQVVLLRLHALARDGGEAQPVRAAALGGTRPRCGTPQPPSRPPALVGAELPDAAGPAAPRALARDAAADRPGTGR